MLANINNLLEINKIDEFNVYGSVEALADQCLHAYLDASKVNVPKDYQNIDSVVMTGMGGSGLGARVIESVFAKELKIPLIRVNGYYLPNFIGKSTLVICSSYSGTTEETLENAKQAIAKKAKWMAIASGSHLIELAKTKKVPFYKIDPKYNPSNQPRMAIGYSIIGQLVLASKAGLFKLKKSDVKSLSLTLAAVKKQCSVEQVDKLNPAKALANKLYGKLVVFVSSEHLSGAMHTVNNQFNENAKTFSFDFQIPELNHHLMEGFKHPKTNSKYLFIFFANSKMYPSRIQQRFSITQDVVNQNGIKYFSFDLKSKTKLNQAFELIQFGSYVNLYLSILYGQNPAPIPWVDYFKIKLGQPLR